MLGNFLEVVPGPGHQQLGIQQIENAFRQQGVKLGPIGRRHIMCVPTGRPCYDSGVQHPVRPSGIELHRFQKRCVEIRVILQQFFGQGIVVGADAQFLRYPVLIVNLSNPIQIAAVLLPPFQQPHHSAP